jgi:hypothetical protein
MQIAIIKERDRDTFTLVADSVREVTRIAHLTVDDLCQLKDQVARRLSEIARDRRTLAIR